MDKVCDEWSLDVTAFLRPISPEYPAGESLRYDSVYDRIREARRADDPNLPQGLWKTDVKRADWRLIETLCREALLTRSKDLQLAAWLCEAWLQLQGAAGVAAGLQLLTGLCTTFWETVHPPLTGESLDARTAPLRWLDEKLTLKLKQLPVTQPPTTDLPPYTWADRESTLRTAHGGQTVTPAQFRESVMLSPSAFYLDLAEKLNAALAALAALQACLAETCGVHAPSLSQFQGVLHAMQQMVKQILTERSTAAGAASPSTAQVAVGSDTTPTQESITLCGRDAAYQTLAQIAEYLQRIEPHSPAPYLIKRAVAWGSMSLTDLLLELMQNSGDRQAIFALLGVKEGGSRK